MTATSSGAATQCPLQPWASRLVTVLREPPKAAWPLPRLRLATPVPSVSTPPAAWYRNLAAHPDPGPDPDGAMPGPATALERVTGIEPASRAWKARPGTPLSRDATPTAQLSAPANRPLLSVGNRQRPLLRARGGHGRRGPSWFAPSSHGRHLNRRVRLVLGDHLPRWQAPVRAHGRPVGRQTATSPSR
jgi:hypothetical protein